MGYVKILALIFISILSVGQKFETSGKRAANIISLRYSGRPLELGEGTEKKKPCTPEGRTGK